MGVNGYILVELATFELTLIVGGLNKRSLLSDDESKLMKNNNYSEVD